MKRYKLLMLVCILGFQLLLVTGLRATEPAKSRRFSPVAMPAFLPFISPIAATESRAIESASKKGIGVTGLDDGCLMYECDELYELGATWGFIWKTEGFSDCDVEHVMMMYSSSTVDGRDLTAFSPWVLTFNEPEHWSQAYTTPTKAAEDWRKLEQYYPDNKLISPAIAWIDNRVWENGSCWWYEPGMTCRWLEDFYNEYERIYNSSPRIDAMGGHCYGFFGPDLLTVCTEMVEYLTERAAAWNVDGGIWINEFGPSPGSDQAEMNRQLAETLVYFEGNPNIARYAVWTLRVERYPTMNCYECDSRQMTSYGEVYQMIGHTAFMPIVMR